MSNPPSENEATERITALLKQQIEQLQTIELLLREILKSVAPPQIADAVRIARALSGQ